MSELFRNVENPEEMRFAEGSVIDKDEIEIGGERKQGNKKRFVDISIERNNRTRNAGSFVTKEFANEQEAFEELQKAEVLGKAGVPVPPTHRISFDREKNKHVIVYTDFSEGGKHQVWSANNTAAELQQMQITSAEKRQLKRTMAAVAEKAAEAGYTVDGDAYFLRRKDAGELDLFIGDLGTGIRKDDTERSKTNNKEYAEELLRYAGLY